VDVLVCALPDAERRELDLADEAAAAERAGLEFVAIPIADRSVPGLDALLPRLRELVGRLEAGGHVVCHCRFGLGRGSLLAAALLVLEGVDPEAAWHRVARARGQRVPDTEQQRRLDRHPASDTSAGLTMLWPPSASWQPGARARVESPHGRPDRAGQGDH
jgi:protein-tyrosine phosphatase